MLPDPLTPGCRSFTSTNRKAFLTLPGGHSGGYAGYLSRKERTRRRTAAYIAGVTRPVWVFCWLG